MPGRVIDEKLRRLLQDIDIPALLIFLKKHQDITVINLSNNHITDAGFINLLDHSILYGINELDLQNNDITYVGINYMYKKGERIKVKCLRLKGNKFGVEGSQLLALFLLKNTYMLCLDAGEVDQTSASLIYFVAVLSFTENPHNNTLKALDISRPNPACMYHFDTAHFATVIGDMIRHNTCLAELHLQKYSFNCHDIELMIMNAKYNSTLVFLNLGNNNIGDHGVDHLGKWLIKRPALRTLILRGNIITDHGARALSFVLPYTKLKSIDISYNRITDDGIVDILNSLKKSPLLRHLRIFGNTIGHPAAQIVRRMLISKVLEQENIDVRPYCVDDRWYFARYQGVHSNEKYYDVPYSLFEQMSPDLPKKTDSKKKFKYLKYVYTTTSEHKIREIQSNITVITTTMPHTEDCRCCYCVKCEEPHYDKECRTAEHPDECACCECPSESISDLSLGIPIDRKDEMDPAIECILKNVNSTTRAKIQRWTNIDEEILDEDLKEIAGPEEESGNSTESHDSCNCSWIPLSLSMVLQYLNGKPLDDIMAESNNDTIILKGICNKGVTEHSNASKLRYCTNVL